MPSYTALMTTGGDPTNGSVQAGSEIDRLRAAVEVAQRAARRAELDAGRLRGELAEMRVQLGRARQEQEWATAGRPAARTRVIESLTGWYQVAKERVSGLGRRRPSGPAT